MSKNIILVLASFLIANSSFATKARLLALGMNEADSEGSYYIEDNRNIFMNVANVNNYADKVFVEFGSQANVGFDTDSTPKAMGGFLHKHGEYVMGAYLGNEANTTAISKVLAGAQPLSDNFLDFFLGSEAMGMKWGVNLSYANDSDKSVSSNEKEASYYGLRLGVMGEKWESFLRFGLGAKAKIGSSLEYKGKLSLHVGGSYDLAGGKVFGYYKKSDWEQTFSTVMTKGAASAMSLGYGRSHKLDHGTLFSSVAFIKKSLEVKFTTDPAKLENTMVPLTLGFEGKATSWLSLRGSISQNLMGTKKNEYGDAADEVGDIVAGKVEVKAAMAQAGAAAAAAGGDATAQATASNAASAAVEAAVKAATESGVNDMLAGAFGADTNGKDASILGSTVVSAGATLHFGKINVDGLLSGAVAKTGLINSDSFLARVALTYSF